MKKEKTVRTYQRRTKTGKVVTVRQHTAKYDAAEKAKEVSKKEGAGKELEAKRNKMPNPNLPMNEYLDELKKRKQEVKEESEKDTTPKKVRPVGSGTNGPEPKKKKSEKEPKSTKASKPTTSEPAFTAAEFKEWYRGTGSAADKKVAKALRAQLGRSGYRKLEDEAIDSYSSRGHLSMFKRVSGGSTASTGAKSTSSKTSKKSKVITNKDIEHALRWDEKRSKSFDAALKKVTSSGARTTREVKEGLAKLGYDYDTGKKVRKVTTEVSKSSSKTTSDSNEGSLKIPDGVKEPRGLRKAVMDAGYHVKYQNGKWKQQMVTGTWRVTTPREIIRGAKEDISTHPSWATKKEAMDKAKKERYMEKHRKAYENYVYEPPKATKSENVKKETKGDYFAEERRKNAKVSKPKKKTTKAVSVDDVKQASSIHGGLAKLGLREFAYGSPHGSYTDYQHESGKLFRVTNSGAVYDITPTRKGKRKSLPKS